MPFTACWAALLVSALILLLGPPAFSLRVFELLAMPDARFYWTCVVAAAAWWAAGVVWEAAVCELRARLQQRHRPQHAAAGRSSVR